MLGLPAGKVLVACVEAAAEAGTGAGAEAGTEAGAAAEAEAAIVAARRDCLNSDFINGFPLRFVFKT